VHVKIGNFINIIIIIITDGDLRQYTESLTTVSHRMRVMLRIMKRTA